MFIATGLDLLGVALIAPFLSLTLSAPGSDFSLPPWLQDKGASSLGLLGGALLVVFVAKAYAAYRVQRAITRLTESERARLMTELLAPTRPSPTSAPAAEQQRAITTVVCTRRCSPTASWPACSGWCRRLVSWQGHLAWTDLARGRSPDRAPGRVLGCRAPSGARSVGRAEQRGTDRKVSVAVSRLGALREVRILGRESLFPSGQTASEGWSIPWPPGEPAVGATPGGESWW
jgi:hypothetical protein